MPCRCRSRQSGIDHAARLTSCGRAEAQMFLPSVVMALRMLLPLKEVKEVVVSTLPLELISPTTRTTADPPVVLVLATLAVPTAALYPVTVRY